jgi:ATP-binding cassette subfamily B multidrug efflux pump
MNRIFSYIKQFKWYFIVGTSFIFISIGLDMLNPRLMKVAIDEIIIGGRMELLATVLAALMGITITRAVLGYSKELLFDFGGQRVVERLRQELFAHLQSLSFSFFDKINTGELMSRIKEDVDNIFRLVCFGGMLFIEQVVYFTVATVMLFTIHWRLALVAVALMPFIAWIAFRLEAKIGVIFGKISDQGVKINTTAQENLAGVRLVKAFGREKYEILKFFTQNKENYDLRVEQAMFWGRYFPLIEFLTNLAVVLVITGGGWFVIREEISIGTLVAFSNYIYMIIWPMRMLGWLTNLLAEARASAGKIENLFAEKPVIKEKEKPVAPKRIRGEIIFDRVSFEHNGRLILKDISFRVRPGGTLAIMGMTGAGKSSIINLIPRYYDCTGGTIYLDGIDIKDLPLQLLRSEVSVIMQEPFLFSNTIEENVRFGAEGVAEAEIKKALADAAADDFIVELPEGSATVIGERGIGLSGGEKQRLTIARALVKKGKILILDDATSNLDMETEYRVQKALAAEGDRTKIIIAHRISAVKDADEILIIEDGEVVERGNHQQLLALKQRYYRIYCEQFRGLAAETAG